MLMELAFAAMNEMVKLAEISGPLWFQSLDGNGEELNLEEYARFFPPFIGMKPANLTAKATKATGTVMINSLALVETLTDTSQWVDWALFLKTPKEITRGQRENGSVNCHQYGGQTILGEIHLDEHHLKIENARLRDEYNWICLMANKVLGKPLSSFNCSMSAGVGNFGLKLAVGRTDFGATNSIDTALPAGLDFGNGISSVATSVISSRPTPNMTGMDVSFDKTMLIEIAFAAMNELVKLAEISGPLWFRSLDGNGEELNLEEYARSSPPCIGVKPANFTTEATKATGAVMINSLGLVETLMDTSQWVDCALLCKITRGQRENESVNCHQYGGQTILGEIHMDEHHLKIENARLRDEYNWICLMANKVLGKPLSSFNCSMSAGVGNFGLKLAVGRNDFGATNSVDTALPVGLDFGNGVSSAATPVISPRPTSNMTGMDVSFDKIMLIVLAFAAMNKLVNLAEISGPLWFRSFDGNGEELNL
ncbi:hypothetical protein T459_00278 [Capsicum annuum]|uniref:START domain-containing protein n=1 Tax=Capsicum annuum TaxID=4072 RepID=A0A2G3ADS8_CAPAN|nr:hypothetical protein T459_00278 [Capsicum annuum]